MSPSHRLGIELDQRKAGRDLTQKRRFQKVNLNLFGLYFVIFVDKVLSLYLLSLRAKSLWLSLSFFSFFFPLF